MKAPSHCTRKPSAHCNRWQLAADRLYRVLDEIELMSDPAIKAPDGINRMKQINMFARDAVQSYIRTTQQEQK